MIQALNLSANSSLVTIQEQAEEEEEEEAETGGDANYYSSSSSVEEEQHSLEEEEADSLSSGSLGAGLGPSLAGGAIGVVVATCLQRRNFVRTL